MKRFTETNKWVDPWFRKLSPVAKLLWIYFTDNCNAVGLIDLDVDSASFHIGEKVKQEHLEEMAGRIQAVEGGKYFIPKFISFQYTVLTDTCPPHRRVIKMISELGLVDNKELGYSYPNGNLTLTYDKPLPTLPEPKVKRAPQVATEITIPDSLNIPEFAEAWDKWKKYLKERGKKHLPITQEEQLQKLSAMGVQGAIASISNSISYGWATVYPPKNINTGGSQSIGNTVEIHARVDAEIARVNAIGPSPEPPPREDPMARFAPAPDDDERIPGSWMTKGQLKAQERTEYENMRDRFK